MSCVALLPEEEEQFIENIRQQFLVDHEMEPTDLSLIELLQQEKDARGRNFAKSDNELLQILLLREEEPLTEEVAALIQLYLLLPEREQSDEEAELLRLTMRKYIDSPKIPLTDGEEELLQPLLAITQPWEVEDAQKVSDESKEQVRLLEYQIQQEELIQQALKEREKMLKITDVGCGCAG